VQRRAAALTFTNQPLLTNRPSLSQAVSAASLIIMAPPGDPSDPTKSPDLRSPQDLRSQAAPTDSDLMPEERLAFSLVDGRSGLLVVKGRKVADARPKRPTSGPGPQVGGWCVSVCACVFACVRACVWVGGCECGCRGDGKRAGLSKRSDTCCKNHQLNHFVALRSI